MSSRPPNIERAADGQGGQNPQNLPPGKAWTWRQEARRESRADLTIEVMRNDLTVIRGQAQLIKRALAEATALDTRQARDRLDAIITSVDEASMELQQLQASHRSRSRDM